MDAGDAGDGPPPPTCGIGTWVLSESGSACSSCFQGISDVVVLGISADLAANGGTATDSEGNDWTFDPATCTATLRGDCDALDAIDFDAGRASCEWLCGGACPACPGSCTVRPF